MVVTKHSAEYAIDTVKVFTIQLKNAVIPAWMLESSHKDVKPREDNITYVLNPYFLKKNLCIKKNLSNLKM
ncbi:MAG: hypothetical protein WCK96_18335 [Methylococcales bacterium]